MTGVAVVRAGQTVALAVALMVLAAAAGCSRSAPLPAATDPSYEPVEFDLVVPSGVTADVQGIDGSKGRLFQTYEDNEGSHQVFGLGGASLEVNRSRWGTSAIGLVFMRPDGECWQNLPQEGIMGKRFTMPDPHHIDPSVVWERVRLVLKYTEGFDGGPRLVYRYFVFYDAGSRIVIDSRSFQGYVDTGLGNGMQHMRKCS